MGLAEVFIAVSAVLVSLWLGRGASPGARWALWMSALAVSAAMFLPMSVLRGLIAPEWLRAVDALGAGGPWKFADLAHLLAFFWLALVLWLLRPDLRGGGLLGALVVLAFAAEAMQVLTVERSPRAADVLVNLVGAAGGCLLAIVLVAIGKRWRSPPLESGNASLRARTQDQ